MQLFIFTTNKDLSLPLLVESAKKLRVNCQIIYYSELSLKNGTIYAADQKLTINRNDKIMIRWPWDAKNTAKDYNFWVKILLLRHEYNFSIDKKVLANYSHFYEDKLFQSEIFKRLKIPAPDTTYYQTRQQLLDDPVYFPAIIKKRISSRSKGNYLVNNIQEVFSKAKPRLRRYIIQTKIEFIYDVRMIFLKCQYIGSVSRKTYLRKQNRLAVKMDRRFEVSPDIIKQAEMLCEYLGADFLGIDVLIDGKGNHYFLEANVSPQFVKFKEITGVNLGELVIKAALE